MYVLANSIYFCKMCILEQHSMIMFSKIYIKNICYKSYSVLLLSLMFLRSIYLYKYLKNIYIFALLLKATLVSFEKSSSDEKPSLWGGGRGCQEKKGTYSLGHWHWQWSFPQLAIFYMHLLSLVTFIFFSAPGCGLQAVHFWNLQVSQCGTTSFCL